MHHTMKQNHFKEVFVTFIVTKAEKTMQNTVTISVTTYSPNSNVCRLATTDATMIP